MIALIIFTLLDLVTTYYGIITGKADEANPTMKWLFKLPLLISIAFAVLINAATILIVWYIGYEPVLWYMAGARSLAVYSNCLIIWDRRKANEPNRDQK